MSDEEYHIAKFLRLKNGDDIVAETVEIEDENGILYMVMNPLKVVYAQSPHDGYLSVLFTPWVFPRICDKQEFTINYEDVMLMSDVTEKMNEYYWNSLDVLQQKIEQSSDIEYEQDPEPEPETSLLETLQQLAQKRTYH